jgi:aminoglycoside/choline kinase family phosphotransferase
MELHSDGNMRARVREALAGRFDRTVADAAELEKMGGHASLRIYWRVHLPTGGAESSLTFTGEDSTLVAMVLAPDYDPYRSAEGPENERLETDVLPFVDVQRYLAGLAIPVPALEHLDREVDVLLLEDLGDRTFGDVCRAVLDDPELGEAARRRELEDLYGQAVDLLVDVQSAFLRSRRSEGSGVEEASICWRRRFDRRTLRWELDHYVDWGLEARDAADDLDGEVRDLLDESFDALVDALLELETLPVHRDFQSSNLMYRPRQDRESPWVVIDFQDALVGPYVYDLVSLLRDSYIELPPDLVSELVDEYLRVGRGADLPWCDDPDAVRRAFHLQTVQRKLKDAGRFVYIDREKEHPEFLDYYEPSIRYVDTALRRLSGWDALREALHRLEPSLRFALRTDHADHG